MKSTRVSEFIRRAAILAAAVVVISGARIASAYMAPNGLPVPTTVVVVKPSPGQIFGNSQVVSFGVGGKTYKFTLKDGWVDDPRRQIIWSDIWQLVRQYTPNFNVAGEGSDTFEKIQPGQTVTIRGMFSPLNQTFEVVGVDQSGGPFQAPEHF